MRHAATVEPTTDTVEHKSRPKNGVLSFTRMSGSSIAALDAATWVTDFVNAAYYRRSADEREVDDLRLASCVLTTFWYASRRATGCASPTCGPSTGPSGTTASTPRTPPAGRSAARSCSTAPRACSATGSRRRTPTTSAVDGASRSRRSRPAPTTTRPAAWTWRASARSRRRARLRTSRSGTPIRRCRCPRRRPSSLQLTAPETWPDFASEIGRFTPLRAGGLDGQTFEIEVAAGTDKGRPIFTRGYVTITKLVTPADPAALGVWFAALEAGLARFGDNEPHALPDGAQPLVGFDLTTHAGHFMGAGHNRLLLFTHEGKAFVRAAGTWDPMPWHIQHAYRIAGRDAQHAFWGQDNVVAQSLLHQLALRTAGCATPT